MILRHYKLQTSKETKCLIGADIKNTHICYKTTIQTSVCVKDWCTHWGKF